MKQDNHFVFNHSQNMHIVKAHCQTVLCYFTLFHFFVIGSSLVGTSRDYAQEYTTDQYTRVILLF